MAVIVGVQHYNTSSDLPLDVTQPPVLHTMPLQGAAQPVSLRAQQAPALPTEAQLMEQRKRVNAMFMDYELQLRLNANEHQISTETLIEQEASSR